ncbi:MAG: L,D-transpeptidase [Arachnia sp.]
MKTKLLGAPFVVLALILALMGPIGGASPAAADQVNVSVSTAGSKPIGVTSNAWGVAAGAPNASVSLQVRLSNGAWSTSQRGTTSSSGAYALELSYGKNTPGTYAYRVIVSYLGDTSISNTVTFTRTARMPTASTAGSKTVGAATNVWGSAPDFRTRPVWTEAWVNGRWSVSQRSRTAANGQYTLPLTYGTNVAATHTYRVGVRGVDGRAYYSRQVTIRRVPAISAYTAGSKLVGQGTNAWGTARGAANRPVWSEALVNGKWSVSQRRTTSSTGYYSIPLTYGKNTPGVYKYRIGVKTADGRTYYSNQVTLRRESVHIDSRCYTSGNVICVDRGNQKLYWVKKGKVAWSADVRTGRRGMETRLGVSSIYYKNPLHRSSLYDVDMPWSMFFDGGQAVHYSSEFARIGYSGPGGSHGCVNMRDLNKIKQLYAEAPIGTKVVVYE